MPRKAFTVEEANALIPALEATMQALDREKAEAVQHHDRLQVLELLWGDRLSEAGSPDHAEGIAHRNALVAALQKMERLIQEEILGRGVRFPQGGLEHGLVDFPTTWEGRWVLLCWRRGEPAVSAWHEVDAGFAGRQPITPEHAQRMGSEDDPDQVDDSMLE